MIRHILAAVDFSESSLAALDCARDLARRLSARLTILYVDELPVMHAGELFYLPTAALEEHQAALEERVAVLARTIGSDGIEVRSKVVSGAAYKVIVAVAAEDAADLIVIGTHGRSGIRRMLVGSVAERVVRSSSIPVLTVRLQRDRAAKDPAQADEPEEGDAHRPDGAHAASARGAVTLEERARR